jgi:hypothetical protein
MADAQPSGDPSWWRRHRLVLIPSGLGMILALAYGVLAVWVRGRIVSAPPPDDPERPSGRIWQRPEPFRKFESRTGLGNVTAPVLAGFSLATIALLLTTEPAKRPWLSEWSVAALALSAVLAIYVIQFSSVAAGYASPPSERLDWFPEAKLSDRRLEFARKLQAIDTIVANRYVRRSDLSYELCLIAFLVGLTLLVTPAQWTWLGVVPVAAGGVAILVELAWTVARELPPSNWFRSWLLPGRSNVTIQPPTELTAAEWSAVVGRGRGQPAEGGRDEPPESSRA